MKREQAIDYIYRNRHNEWVFKSDQVNKSPEKNEETSPNNPTIPSSHLPPTRTNSIIIQIFSDIDSIRI